MRYVIDALIVISLFFALAGVVGMLRMPDTFSRMQSATNITTLGVLASSSARSSTPCLCCITTR